MANATENIFSQQRLWKEYEKFRSDAEPGDAVRMRKLANLNVEPRNTYSVVKILGHSDWFF